MPSSVLPTVAKIALGVAAVASGVSAGGIDKQVAPLNDQPAAMYCLHHIDTEDNKCLDACANEKFEMVGVDQKGKCPSNFDVQERSDKLKQCPDGVTHLKYCKGSEVEVTVSTHGATEQEQSTSALANDPDFLELNFKRDLGEQLEDKAKCEACHMAARQLDKVLQGDTSGSSTLGGLMGKVCSVLPQGAQGVCRGLLENMLPGLLGSVVKSGTADTLCNQLPPCRRDRGSRGGRRRKGGIGGSAMYDVGHNTYDAAEGEAYGGSNSYGLEHY